MTLLKWKRSDGAQVEENIVEELKPKLNKVRFNNDNREPKSFNRDTKLVTENHSTRIKKNQVFKILKIKY